MSYLVELEHHIYIRIILNFISDDIVHFFSTEPIFKFLILLSYKSNRWCKKYDSSSYPVNYEGKKIQFWKMWKISTTYVGRFFQSYFLVWITLIVGLTAINWALHNLCRLNAFSVHYSVLYHIHYINTLI